MTESRNVRIGEILVPTDFTSFSEGALRHAVALAGRFHARVRVLHVIPYLVLPAEAVYLDAPVLIPPPKRRQVDEEMRKFVAPLREARMPHEVEIREGEPWEQIVACATETRSDIVVMGTHGTSGIERFLLGSVTEKLIHCLPCPVMTVCHEEGRTWETPRLVTTILCATDFGDPSAQAFAHAVRLAEHHDARLILLHAIEGIGQQDETAFTDLGLVREDLSRKALERLAALIASQETHIPVEPRVAFGRAHREILRTAASERADLIVVGAQGHGRLEHLISGTNAQQVIRGATCPVLTVRRELPAKETARTP